MQKIISHTPIVRLYNSPKPVLQVSYREIFIFLNIPGKNLTSSLAKNASLNIDNSFLETSFPAYFKYVKNKLAQCETIKYRFVVHCTNSI